MKLNIDYYENDIILPSEFEKEIIKKEEFFDTEKEELSYEQLEYSEKLKNNILSWYPLKKNANILEISLDLGEFTGTLCSMANKVTRIEFSKSKAEYLSKRYENLNNLEIIVGNLKKIVFKNKFDYIVLIGNLEYSKTLFDTENPEVELFKLLEKLLTRKGKILFITENKFSAQKIAFDSILEENLSKNEILDILNMTKFKYNKFYYIFPNYKFANVIFSDEYLPNENNTRLDYLRINNEKNEIIYNEKDILKQAIKNNEFDFFANNFFIEISRRKDFIDKKPIFITYNIIRKEKFQLATKIYRNKVIKTNISNTNQSHLNNLVNNLNILFELEVNTIEKNKQNKYIKSIFVKEKTFDNVLVNLIKENKIEEFYKNIDEWIKYIKSKLTISKEIKENIFSYFDIELDKDISSSMNFIKEGLIDLVYENTFKLEDGFYIFDQEWYFENTPIEFIIYRAIKNLYAYNKYIKETIPFEEICEKYKISKYIEKFIELETAIQDYVSDSKIKKLYLKNMKNKIIEDKEEYKANLNKNLKKIIEKKEQNNEEN